MNPFSPLKVPCCDILHTFAEAILGGINDDNCLLITNDMVDDFSLLLKNVLCPANPIFFSLFSILVSIR